MNALQPEPIEEADFHTSLSIKYDAVIVEVSPGLYKLPGVYCEECNAMHTSLFANTDKGIATLLYTLGADALAIGINADTPEVGAVVCTRCGFATSMNLQGRSVRVLDVENYRQYVEVRAERGEPL